MAAELTSYFRGMQERLRQAELRRVEAQAKASEEKTRRRLAVGLAAAVVGLVVTAGGAGAWMLHQHHLRAARVAFLLREADHLKAQAERSGDDLARWSAAVEAVRRLVSVVNDARDAATRGRVANLAEQVEEHAAAAEADARLLDRLVEVREAMDEIPAAQTEAAYAAEFQGAGWDPDTRTPEEIGRAIARRPVRTAVGLAVALDHWAAVRRDQRDRSGADRITAAARAADPDEYRNRLRAALMEPRAQARLAALRELARSAPAAELPPVTAALLGEGLLRAGDPTAAESVLRPAQRRHPAEPWLGQVLAKALEKQSRRPEAIRYYFLARAVRPESVHALAHALERQGEWSEAIAVFREAIRLSPGNARHLSCLARTLRSQGHAREADEALDAAIAAGREALRQAPDVSLHHTLLNIAVNQPGRLDEVVAAYRDAIRRRPDDSRAHFMLGVIFERGGRADESIAEYREAIRLEPDSADAYDGLGVVLANLKHDYAGAVPVFQKLIRLKPDEAVAHCNLGTNLRQLGRIDEAIAAYRAAIRLKPDFADAYVKLGEILCNAKFDQDGGRAALREAIRLEPRHARAHNDLGDSLTIKGRFEEAAAEYREAIRLEPRLAAAHYGLGNVLHHRGLVEEAIAEYRKAIRLEPEFAEAYCNLGDLLGGQGRYAESLVALERGHELGSTRTAWHYPSHEWVAQARGLARLAPRLPALLRGEAQPADVTESLDVALAAYRQGLHVMAARRSAEAFAADPRAEEDLETHHRYNAACSAALAGCGQSKDQPPPDAAARTRLRQQALDWLGADLAARSRVVASRSEHVTIEARRLLVQNLEHWKLDPDLAGVRQSDALEKLSPTERVRWQAFWAEVDRVIARTSTVSD